MLSAFRRDSLGYLSLLSVIAISIWAFYGLLGFSYSQGSTGFDWELLNDSYLHSILWFSIKQAALSALISVLLAWPVARALYYMPDLYYKRLFLSLCLLCFVLPTLVLITGLVVLLGRSGVLTPWLGEDWNLYGLHGVLLAHVFLNMPFVVRALLQQLQSTPDSSWRLAAQLKLNAIQRFILIEWPNLKAKLLMMLGFVFVLCFNSFAVVLALGGGPQSTTLEVAIYQALKYDFAISEALTLAWIQLAIAGGLFLLMTRLGNTAWLSVDTGSSEHIPQPNHTMRFVHRAIYYLTATVLLLPLFALFMGVSGLEWLRFSWFDVLKPLLITLGLGLIAATSALILSYLMLLPIRSARYQSAKRWQWLLEWLSTHTLVVPAMVLSVGLYILLLRRMDLDVWGIVVVALLNTVIVIPFAIQHLRPQVFQYDDQYRRLSASLKLSFTQKWRLEWQGLKPVVVSSFALVLLLAMGDVAIFAIFGNAEWTTLPWLIYSYAGTYRMADASLASIVLLMLCLFIVMWFERPTLKAFYAKNADAANDKTGS